MTNTLLHIGAGRGADIEHALEAARQGARVILVEANGENIEDLREHVREFQSVDVVQAALADRSEAGVLRVFNLDQCSSLRDPSGLEEIFPGLKQVEALSVDVQEAGSFVARLDLSVDDENTLVIDAPGEELAILGSLEKAELLSVFKHVEVHCGVAVHYEGAGDAAAVEALLSKKAYRVRRDWANDPDFCRLSAERDEVQQNTSRLEKSLAERDETIAALEQQAESLRAEVRAARLDVEQRANQVDNLESDIVLSEEGLQTLRSELTTVREKLAASRKDREALQLELQQTAERLRKLEDDAGSRNSAFETVRNDLEARDGRIKSLVEELDATKQALSDNRDAAKRAREEDVKRIEALEGEKAKLEADAKGLRHRISEMDRTLGDSAYRLDLYKMNLQGAEAQLDLLKQLIRRDANVGQ